MVESQQAGTRRAGFARTTIDDVDLAKYDRLGEEWWSLDGPMGTLQKFNPVRVGWIADLVPRTLGRRNGTAERPLDGFRILDVGSGGGILSESLARLGASLVGIDPAPNNVAVAARHAETGGLAVDYRCSTVEEVAKAGETFDAVLVMEVIEHVNDVDGFMRDACACVKPGGMMFGATINRTAKSYALAIVGAEYVLRWLPRGTHDWRRFVTPDEFSGRMQANGLGEVARSGVVFNPLRRSWSKSGDTGCNYMLAARKAA